MVLFRQIQQGTHTVHPVLQIHPLHIACASSLVYVQLLLRYQIRGGHFTRFNDEQLCEDTHLLAVALVPCAPVGVPLHYRIGRGDELPPDNERALHADEEAVLAVRTALQLVDDVHQPLRLLLSEEHAADVSERLEDCLVAGVHGATEPEIPSRKGNKVQ